MRLRRKNRPECHPRLLPHQAASFQDFRVEATTFSTLNRIYKATP